METIHDGWAACVNWDENPKHAATSYVPVHSPKPGLAIQGLILSSRPTGVWTHYLDGTTQPCHAQADKCEYCNRGRRPRWKCYLLYYAVGIGRIALAEITIDAFRREQLLSNSAETLRGRSLKLTRAGQAPNSRVVCSISANVSACVLPAEFDVRPILLRIWGLASQDLPSELVDSKVYKVRKEANHV